MYLVVCVCVCVYMCIHVYSFGGNVENEVFPSFIGCGPYSNTLLMTYRSQTQLKHASLLYRMIILDLKPLGYNLGFEMVS